MQDISEEPLLSRQDEVRLSAQTRRGNAKARERMIKANLRLVVRVAKNYVGYGVPLLDLINEGNIGLMKAVERYDAGKGTKFSTYAIFWIKQGIRRALSDQASTIRLPIHVVEKIAKLRTVEHKLREELGRYPTVNELANAMGIKEETVGNIREAQVVRKCSDLSINRLHIEDIAAPEPEYDPSEDPDLRRALKAALGRLSEQERFVIERRFGLHDNSHWTLDDIAIAMPAHRREWRRFTRERIRQIEFNALRGLRWHLVGSMDEPILRKAA